MPGNLIRVACALCAAVVFAMLAASDGRADYPDRPVDYIIPFGSGGESDIAARLQQPLFKRITGQDLVISFKPGGGGAVVWNELNDMRADGYTIAGINLPHIILQPALGSAYRTADIQGIYIFHYTPNALVVRANSKFGSLRDLVEYARKNPGKLVFSGSGRATANHLAQLQFNKETQVKTGYAAFKGTAASVVALLERKVDASWGYTTIGMQYGRDVRLLAVATEERHPLFPNVPTFKELGYDIVDGAYRGIAVPKATPAAIRNQLSDIFAEINADPAVRTAMEDQGFVPVDIGHGEYEAFIRQRQKAYLMLAEEAGLIERMTKTDKRERPEPGATQ